MGSILCTRATPTLSPNLNMNNSPDFSCRLDHLVVCAESCQQGVDWVRSVSGVSLPKGGKHALMSTHNHLTALSDLQYLEVVSIDPSAPQPDRSRWFQLDDPATQAQLRKTPALSTWVVATNSLDEALAALSPWGVDPGKAVDVRRGDLRWRLTVPDDGKLACGGTFPILIEWPDGMNPVSTMLDQGMRLDSLRLCYPDVEYLQTALGALGIADLVSIEEGLPALSATMHVNNHSFTLE